MMLTRFVARAQDRLARRREYNRLANEIHALTPRDLTDLQADRGEMLRQVYSRVYG